MQVAPDGSSPDAAGDMTGLPEFLMKKKAYKWPEKPKPKLTKLQQEMEDERIRQKAERKRIKTEQKTLSQEMARKIAEAEEALRLKMEAVITDIAPQMNMSYRYYCVYMCIYRRQKRKGFE
jgi:vacuolar-type H+-ATPase subunit I/STV1